MAGMIIGPIVGAVASSVLSDGGGSSGGGGGSVSAPVDPNQAALAASQKAWQDFLLDRMKTKFVPLEDQFIDEAAKAGSDANILNKMGAAHGDVMQGFAQTGKSMAEMARQRGISLTAPKSLALAGDVVTARAAADASAQTAARDTEINRGLALKQAAIGIGRGMDNTAAQLGTSAASIYSSGATIAGNQLNRQRQANMDTGFAVAPIAKALGTGASKMFGQAQNTGASANDDYTYGYTPSMDWGSNSSSWGAYDTYKDGGIVGAARNGPVLRAGMDAQANADLAQRADGGAAVPVDQDGAASVKFFNGKAADAGKEAAQRDQLIKLMQARGVKQRLAGGGVIAGPGGPTDDAVPAVVDGQQPIAVSSGEAVLNEKATSQVLGQPLVHIINALGVLRRTVEQGSMEMAEV